uniref:Uncharacterized protein n=1 Tax=Arundo donax TaxID=35708 RepID=A0A0A9AWM1_ARUDO
MTIFYRSKCMLTCMTGILYSETPIITYDSGKFVATSLMWKYNKVDKQDDSLPHW